MSPPAFIRFAVSLLARCAPILALGLFAAVGLAVFDDYGVGNDEWAQRYVGQRAISWFGGNADNIRSHDPFYGVAFEAPLIFVERALGLEDARDILLSRRLLTHLLFLVGGASVWLLARRMFDSRPLALLALLIFLLHPRIYAHSFFNSKDPALLSVFAIALYAIHRAFRRDTAAAFALCGAAVGLLVGVRIVGFALFAAVIAMRGADFVSAAIRRDGRIHAALTSGAFALAAIPTALLSMPYLLGEPLAFFDGFRILSSHPSNMINNLFMGELFASADNPAFFTVVWMAITTPPMTLALAALGAGAVLRDGARRPLDALANSETRFRLLLAVCLTLTPAALAIFKPNAIEGWRQYYFLYAPMCLLAVCGLDAMIRAARRLGERRFKLLGKSAPASTVAAVAICAAAALGLALTAREMVRIHPLQNIYFNQFVDRETPEYLRSRYDMSYWGISNLQGLEFLMDEYPDERVNVKTHWPPTVHSARILPKEDRERVGYGFPDFYITHYHEHFRISGVYAEPFAPVIHELRVYGNAIMSVAAVNLDMADDETRAAYREMKRETLAGGEPVIRAEWDVYLRDGALVYLKEPCAEDDTRGVFNLDVSPGLGWEAADAARRRARGTLAFMFEQYGVRLDGGCMIRRPLPDYPIAGVETARWIPFSDSGAIWYDSALLPPDEGAARAYAREFRRVSEGGDPLIRSGFDVYLDGGALVWLKSPCAEDDARGRFLLSVFPDDPNDLADNRRESGHESRNFTFAMRGARFDGDCMARVELPDYAIRAIEVGQWIPGGAGLWSGRAEMPEVYRKRYAEVESSGEPLIRSEFDVYLRNGALHWLKSPCAEDDTRGRFLLSVFPDDPNDLPARWRAAGHESRNFTFANQGARLDDTCMARIELPDYAIRAIEVGQWIPGGATLWFARTETPEAYRKRYAEVESSGEPLIRSGFDVYLRNGALHWLKSPCAEDDTRGRFLLSVFPRNPEDLPAAFREAGHESRNFTFANQGARVGDTCMARADLPDYAIRAIEVGQWLPGGATLWSARADVPR